VHFVFALLFLVSIVATIEWIYLKARKSVRWTCGKPIIAFLKKRKLLQPTTTG
jgi:hypothetical protein